MRIPAILVAAAAAFTVSVAGARPAAPAPQAVRYCHAQRDLTGGTLFVTRAVDSEGRFVWQQATSAALREDASFGTGIRIAWRPGPGLGPSREAVVEFYFDRLATRRLPVESRVRIFADGAESIVPERVGKKGRAFQTPLAGLLARFPDRAELRFQLIEPDYLAATGYFRAAGRLDLGAVRNAAAAFPAIDEELDAMQADFLRKCSLREEPGAPPPSPDEFICPVVERDDDNRFHADTRMLIWSHELGRGLALGLNFYFKEEEGAAFVASGIGAFGESPFLRFHVASGTVNPGRDGLDVEFRGAGAPYLVKIDRTRLAALDWDKLKSLEADGREVVVTVGRPDGEEIVTRRLPPGLFAATERRLQTLYAEVMEKRKDFAVRCEQGPDIII